MHEATIQNNPGNESKMVGIRTLIATAIFAIPIGHLCAGDLVIDQSGQGGGIDGRVIDESIAFTIDVSQEGTENTLAFVLESDITANIVQEGNYGEINLDLKSERDNLSISQFGSNNTITGVFSGSANSSNILQENSSNTLVVDISGQLNILDVDQTGENNQMSLDLKGNEGNFKLSQTGNSNELDLTQLGSNISLTIEQSGTGEKISIYQ